MNIFRIYQETIVTGISQLKFTQKIDLPTTKSYVVFNFVVKTGPLFKKSVRNVFNPNATSKKENARIVEDAMLNVVAR